MKLSRELKDKMNHLCARQRIDGKWDYTYNGCPYGYCRIYEPIPEDAKYMTKEMIIEYNAKMAKLAAKFHDVGHATEKEACDCYAEYLLDVSLQLHPTEPENADQQNRCQVCKKFTACHAFVGSYHIFILCPEHHNRDEVKKLLRVGESWES